MFARPFRVAIAVVIAIGSVSTAAYASDASLVTTTTDQVVVTEPDQNELAPATHRLITELAFTSSAPVVSANLHSSVVTQALPSTAITSLDLILARTPVGARLVANKLNATTYSWNSAQMSCLNTLWSRESHWNFKSRNTRSGAYGIPQANPGTKMASAGRDWRTNPVTQIKWGMSYVNSRYGTPCSALATSNRRGWY